MTDKPVRVRFAPSPTGYLHIGGARTALFTWLYARANHGKFILRIEDTDQNRFVEDSLQNLLFSLRWLGLQWDEGPEVGGDYGPYIQSERLENYQKWANWLVEQGKAYRCYATTEELARAKEIQEKSGKRGAGYERMHRYLSDEERTKLHAEREGKHVIRFAMPLEGTTEVYDRVRGKIVFDNSELSDAVLLKSDGFPTYHLAVVVDDHLMEISHVTRTTEWMPSAPLHVQLYEAFGWEQPEWVHLPFVLCPNGEKMSKRKPCKTETEDEIVPVSVDEYIAAGYQPEAVINWLTNIGWNFGDDIEFFYVEDTIKRFNFDRINPAPARVPLPKLKALNGEHIRHMSDEQVAAQLRPMLEQAYGALDEAKFKAIIPYIKGRINPLREGVPLVKFLFGEFTPVTVEQMLPKKMDAAQLKDILQRSHDLLSSLEDFSAASQEKAMRAMVEAMGLKAGQVFSPLRWAVIAQEVSPPLFESMEVLGKEISLTRLQEALNSF